MSAKSKIVIAEDDPILAKMYTHKCAALGLEAKTVHNGKDALDLMKSFHPDLVLMDLMMPVMDGFTAIQKAQEDPELKNIPIVVLTNLSTAEDANRAITMGAKDYIVKSNLTPSEVMDKVASFLP